MTPTHATMKDALATIGDGKTRHIVAVSGGKDSAALAVYMKQRYPELPVEYVFCDTECELPETYEYIEKMEDTLGKVVADTPAQSAEDYRTMMSLRRARTRAQPGDPAQWRALLDSLEAETELYARGEGWLTIEGVAKEMKDVMPPGSDGLRQAEETLLYARAQRSSLLTYSSS